MFHCGEANWTCPWPGRFEDRLAELSPTRFLRAEEAMLAGVGVAVYDAGERSTCVRARIGSRLLDLSTAAGSNNMATRSQADKGTGSGFLLKPKAATT